MVVHLQHSSSLAKVVDLRLLLFVVRRGSVGFLPKESEVSFQCGSDQWCSGTNLGGIINSLFVKTVASFFFICAWSNDGCVDPKEGLARCCLRGSRSPCCLNCSS